MRRFVCLLLATLLALSLCGCGGMQESRLDLFAMNTYMVITAEGGDTEEAVKSVSREISRLENALAAPSTPAASAAWTQTAAHGWTRRQHHCWRRR